MGIRVQLLSKHAKKWSTYLGLEVEEMGHAVFFERE